MQRLKDYCGFLAWQTGISYLLLWAVTYLTIFAGPAVFAQSGACHVDDAQVLFYWACDPASPFKILASVANFALTTVVWAPVFVAAATLDPGAALLAAPIVAVHVFGLPLGILVMVRLSAQAFDAVRALLNRARNTAGGPMATDRRTEPDPVGHPDRARSAAT